MIKAYRVVIPFRDEKRPRYGHSSKKYVSASHASPLFLDDRSNELQRLLYDCQSLWYSYCDKPIHIEEYDAAELVRQRVEDLQEVIESKQRDLSLLQRMIAEGAANNF